MTMKLGCCLNMLGDSREPVGRRYMDTLRRAGYDYMELPLAQIMALTETEFRKLLDEIHMSGIPCECCNNFFPASVRLTGEEADSLKISEYVKQAMDRAERMGAKIIVFGSSGAKNVPDGFACSRAFCQVADTLRLIDTLALPAGIRIAMEPLNRKESNMICSLEEGKLLLREADSASARLLVDYYHFFMEKESFKTLEKLASDIIHVHFADPAGRSFPAAPCEAYERFFAVLKNSGYDGRVSIEAYAKEPEKEIEKAVWIRQYF